MPPVPHRQAVSMRDLRARAGGGIEFHVEPMSAMGTRSQKLALPVPASGRPLGELGAVMCLSSALRLLPKAQ